MPDPKLIAAMEEVKAILAKHDLTAVVFLGSPSHVEYHYKLHASWTCCRLEEDGQFKARLKTSDYPSPLEARKVVEETVGMLAGFADVTQQAHENLSGTLKMFGQRFHIEHVSAEEPRHGRDRDH
jgi:hypothetical protein